MTKLTTSKNLSLRALEEIRQDITSGRLTPGTTVSASTLAEKYGVSRTPIREALLQLAQAGMVRMDKNRGATVLQTSLEDLVEVFQLRLMIEVPLSAKAAGVRTASEMERIRSIFSQMQQSHANPDSLLKLDRDLHISIAHASGNQRAAVVLTDLRNLVLTRGVGTTSTSRTGQELVDDHLGLINALQRQDPDKAADEMKRHILNTARLLISQEAHGDPKYNSDWVENELRLLRALISEGSSRYK